MSRLSRDETLDRLARMRAETLPRYYVVPRGSFGYGIRDRKTGELVIDYLSQSQAHAMAKRQNERVQR